MLRKELIDKLDLIAPALAGNQLIPILSHIWFKKSQIMAFNDQIAIETPCATGIECALPGDTLISLLKNSKAKNVEFVVDKETILVKAASSRLKLGSLPPSGFVFDMPKSTGKPLPVKFEEFSDAINCCMRSVSSDTSVPDQLGVTLLVSDGKLHLYSTNDATISHAKVKLTGKQTFSNRVVLPTAFCQQLLSIGKPEAKPQLYVHDDHAMLIAGKTSLFGRLVEVDKPLNFEGMLKHHTRKKNEMIPIPTKLQLILERAIIITESHNEKTRTDISVRDGKMKFYSKSGSSEATDTMQVNEHPDVATKLEPRLLKNGYGYFDKFLVGEDSTVMTKNEHTYIVAASG